MALCTIINATALIAVPAFGRGAVVLVHLLWWLDVALTLASSFLIPFVMFHIHTHALESMTAVWLLPIVPTVVAAASGAYVAPLLAPGTAMIVITVSGRAAASQCCVQAGMLGEAAPVHRPTQGECAKSVPHAVQVSY